MAFQFLPDVETEDLEFGDLMITIQPIGYRQMRIARRRRARETIRELAGVNLGSMQDTSESVEMTPEQRAAQDRNELLASYDEETVLEAGIRAVQVAGKKRKLPGGKKWAEVLPESIGQPVFEALIDRYGVTKGNARSSQTGSA